MSDSYDPRADKLYRFLANFDFCHGDLLEWKRGGSGDNGNILMHGLEAFFREVDEEVQTVLQCPVCRNGPECVYVVEETTARRIFHEMRGDSAVFYDRVSSYTDDGQSTRFECGECLTSWPIPSKYPIAYDDD